MEVPNADGAASTVPLSWTNTLVTTPPMSQVELQVVDSAKGAGEKSTSSASTAVPESVKDIENDHDSLSARPIYSTLRRYCLLAIFCLAQFLDVFNSCSLFAAIPVISSDLHMESSESVWTVSALQLSFASFLLVSGRISDVYSPKSAFIIGLLGVGFINLGVGFVRNKILLFVLRGITGFFGALTIPSALNLLAKLFPNPEEQSRALSIYGATGAIANICGYVIGAIFVQLASWHWVFWFATCIALPLALISVWLIPSDAEIRKYSLQFHKDTKTLKGIDFVGVSILTAAFILLIYAVTSGSSSGWGSAKVLAPLIISIFLIGAFLYYETLIPDEQAVFPPSTWFYPNFSVLFGVALLPYLWWISLFLVYTQYWDSVFHWSPLTTALHILPLGLAGLTMTTTGPLARKISPKWLILAGEVMALIGSILLPFSGPRDRYWPIVFPAFLIGSAGIMLATIQSNIAIFATTPPRMAGTVGAIYNSALQLGSAVGIAVITSIQTSIEDKGGPDGPQQFSGRADSLWFLMAVVALEVVCMIIFYDTRKDASVSPMEGGKEVKEGVSSTTPETTLV